MFNNLPLLQERFRLIAPKVMEPADWFPGRNYSSRKVAFHIRYSQQLNVLHYIVVDVITVFLSAIMFHNVFFFKLFAFCSYFCIRIVMAYRKSSRYCCLMKFQESLFSPTFYKSLFYSILYWT
jgi:hypothetical protein